MQQWVLAFHLIFVICWFAGLFYLPRLFVYHAMTTDSLSIARFTTMERKLYYGIIMPSALLATGTGLWLVLLNLHFYIQQAWMLTKFLLVLFVWIYQGLCGWHLNAFQYNKNRRSHVYYRWFNEVATALLIGIVICVIVQPSF